MEETAHEAEPKGQANLANSQAKEPQPDRSLERMPLTRVASPMGSREANLSGKQDRDRKESFFSVSFCYCERRRMRLSGSRKAFLYTIMDKF